MNFGTGLTVSLVAGNATDHHSFDNITGGDVFLMVVNGGGGSINVTIYTAQTLTSQNLTVQDVVVAVGAGVTKMIGPFPTTTFNQSDGKVYVDLSGDTSVTIGAIRHGATS
jgi:hypothetical protein